MDSFILAAREWNTLLLHDVGAASVTRHLDSAMQLAVALHCQDDAEAERAVAGLSSSEQQIFLTLSTILRRLIEAAIREHMIFLLPSTESTEIAASITLQTELTKRQNVLQSLPEAFVSRFRELLETHWDKLVQATKTTTSSLPRVQQLEHHVATDNGAGKQIILRLQTSDGQTRRIHVPLKQFHQLRHSAATVLQEMNQVEAHPMMRLAYMQKRQLETQTSNAP
ncbi:hypothetical protein P3T76_014275 [Phytophthora citrophthora]|uniref:COMM domain-containing protein n=1 Tax=Phytophthora citrophthora TaxID=4793 RepID=A0AAD9G1Z1_9STRA|nr:hypothetical protein P3T76_014275 [Phytophthora citrophthora]